MDSFSFLFTTNKSYPNAATHPITIPKRHYKYLSRHCRADRLDINIVGVGWQIRGWLTAGALASGSTISFA